MPQMEGVKHVLVRRAFLERASQELPRRRTGKRQNASFQRQKLPLMKASPMATTHRYD
jgi:hypothetical protein